MASLAGFAGALDLSMIFVAFPAISDAFPGASAGELSWVVTVYSIVLAALLIPCGRLADRFGRRRLFLWGVSVFGLGALLSGAAPSPTALTGARALQAVGGALLLPASMGVLLAEFPRERRGTAIGAWGGVGGLATVTGPLLGSALLSVGGWRWVLLVNVPLAAVAYWGARRMFTESVDPDAHITDLIGSALLMAAIAGFAFTIVQGPDQGWSSPAVICSATVGVVAAMLVIRRSSTHPDPVIDLDLLRNRLFRAANVVAFLFSAAFFAMFFGVILFVTEVWDEPSSRAGLYMIPAQLTAAVTAFAGGRLADRFGHRQVMIPGSLSFAAGALLLATGVGASTSLAAWSVALVLMGAGLGTVFPSFQSGAVAQVPPARFSVASATTQTNSRIAGTLGVAVAVALVGGAGDDPGAFDRLWFILAGLAALAALASWWVDTRPLAMAATVGTTSG